MTATVPGNARVHNIRPIVIELVVPINEAAPAVRTRGSRSSCPIAPACCTALAPNTGFYVSAR
jgi:hypothetical protein